MSNKNEGKLRSDGSPCETNEQCKSNICHNEVCISEEENEELYNKLNNDFFQMREELDNIINNSKSNKDEIESIEKEILIKREEKREKISKNKLKVITLQKKKKENEKNLKEEEIDMKLNESFLNTENNRNTRWDGHRWTRTKHYESDGYEFNQKIIKNKRAIKNMKEEIRKLTEQIDSINKLIKDYNDELNTLIKKLEEKHKVGKKYTREIGTILKDTSDTSEIYRELQKTKSNKKDKELCRICLGPILQGESCKVCPNAKCNTKFHNDCIERFCISTDIKEKYDYNQEVEMLDEEGFQVIDDNGDAVTVPLDVEYYVKKKCPICGESWEEFCKNYIKEEEEEFTDYVNFRPIPSTFMDLNRIAQANRSPSNFSHSPSSPFSIPSRSSSRSRYSTPNNSGFNSPTGSPTRKGGKKRRTNKRKAKRKKTKRKSYKKK